jgi:hypothetical protein
LAGSGAAERVRSAKHDDDDSYIEHSPDVSFICWFVLHVLEIPVNRQAVFGWRNVDGVLIRRLLP